MFEVNQSLVEKMSPGNVKGLKFVLSYFYFLNVPNILVIDKLTLWIAL